jgi:hypothetical protein
VQTADVFSEVKLTSGRRLAIIDSSVDEVARLEADRIENAKADARVFLMRTAPAECDKGRQF